MRLGASAMAPRGYVAFCQRQPQDCGADASRVLSAAARADGDYQALALRLTPEEFAAKQTAFAAAITARAQARLQKAAYVTPVATDLLPAPELRTSGIRPIEVAVSADFIDPAEAAREQTETRAPSMTPELWAKLNAVNAQVNAAILQRTDLDEYGQSDRWATPIKDGVAYGDCEDYALEKQRALVAAGLPREALNLAIVTTRWGETHAVLLVNTSDGEFVLDNLRQWVSPWKTAPYRWVERQVNGEAFNWVSVERGSVRRPAAPLARDGLLIAALQ